MNNDEVVINDEEKNKIDEKKVEMVVATSLKPHFCALCGFSGTSNSNLLRHFESTKHKDKIENPDAVVEGGFKCKNCDSIYKSNQGLWSHNKKCKPDAVIVAVSETDIPAKIDNLKVIIQKLSKVLEVNDGDITEETIDEPVVSMNDEVVVLEGHKSPFICLPCGYPCKRKTHRTKHQTSKKHKDKIENPDAVVEGGFKCKNCDSIYKSNQRLWSLNKKCKPATVIVVVPEPDLHAKIDNLERVIIDMTNQQLVINNKVIQQCL